MALLAGMAIGLLGWWPSAWQKQRKTASTYLIQGAIVLLGVWLSVQQLMRAGAMGLALSTGGVLITCVLGLAIMGLLRCEREVGTLTTAGTAICGGSAIAATSGVIGASSAATAMATAMVFVLNAAGVYLYPVIGRHIGLSDAEFGAWCALGVHDVAGVVAAAKSYGDGALEYATVIKLSRVLWIVPVAMGLAWWMRRGEGKDQRTRVKTPVPWYVGVFVVVVLGRWVLEGQGVGTSAWWSSAGSLCKDVSRQMLALALFLIGAGITRSALASISWRAGVMGAGLWVVVSVLGLVVVRGVL